MARRALLVAADFPPQSGGIAGYLFGLWSHLPRATTAVLTARVAGDRAFDRTHDLRIYRRRFLWPLPFPLDKLARTVAQLVATPPVVRLERTEILHAAHVLTTGVVALVLKRRLGLPYAVYGFGADLTDYGAWPGLERLRRRVLAEAEGVVTVSEFSAGVVRRLGVPDARIAKVLMGIDTARFRPDLDGASVRARHGLGDRPVVLTVGRLVERKGHDMVIRALPRIAARVPGAAYLVVGEGPTRTRLERLAAEAGVADRVVFAGFVPEAELARYYAASDCFVLCSRQIGTEFEGAGNVTLEASASGRPVVAGRSGGTAEHVLEGETGWLVDPTDVEAIAETIVRLLVDRVEAARLGRAGRRLVEARFVWDRTLAPLKPLL